MRWFWSGGRSTPILGGWVYYISFGMNMFMCEYDPMYNSLGIYRKQIWVMRLIGSPMKFVV